MDKGKTGQLGLYGKENCEIYGKYMLIYRKQGKLGNREIKENRENGKTVKTFNAFQNCSPMVWYGYSL